MSARGARELRGSYVPSASMVLTADRKAGTMKLTSPLTIGARLLPAVEIGEGLDRSTISLELVGRDRDDRITTRLYIDQNGRELYAGEGPSSGCSAYPDAHEDASEAARGLMGATLSFLGAEVERYTYAGNGTREPSEPYLFGEDVAAWSYLNSSEIECLAFELNEGTSWESER